MLLPYRNSLPLLAIGELPCYLAIVYLATEELPCYLAFVLSLPGSILVPHCYYFIEIPSLLNQIVHPVTEVSPLPTWLQSWVSQQVGLIPVRNVDQYPSGFPSRPVVVLSEDLDLYCRLTKIQAMNRSYTLYTMHTHLVMEVLKIILDRFVLHKFSKVGSTEQIFFFM